MKLKRVIKLNTRAYMAYSDDQIIDALQKTEGNISAAARALGASRVTIHKRINDSEEVKREYDSVNEASLDEAENELMALVKSGDFRAIKFYLRTKGRTRGYGDQLDVTTGGETIQGSTIVVNAQGKEPDEK